MQKPKDGKIGILVELNIVDNQMFENVRKYHSMSKAGIVRYLIHKEFESIKKEN